VLYTASEFVATFAQDGVGTALQYVGLSSPKDQPDADKLAIPNSDSRSASTSFGPSDNGADPANVPDPNVDVNVVTGNPPPENSLAESHRDKPLKVTEKTNWSEKPTSTSPDVMAHDALMFKGGVHSGLITGLFPQGPTHVSFIPLPDSTEVVIIVGLEGWTPRRGEMVSEDTVKVSSNGIVLQFKGSTKDESHIAGQVEDLVTGKKGSWEVEALSKD
jgi:hypothetical protein